MCGFLYINDKSSFINLKKSHDSLNLQNHRGPDFQGQMGISNYNNGFNFVDLNNNKNQKINLYLGHNRLKIIDLSEKSNQPIFKGKSFFLYNGEFYNFKEFDNENTNSDTLTLFNRLENIGIDFLHNVNGMWSFIYGDMEQNKIFLSRDRYGKKPLYYYNNQSLFIASSEIKSIYSYLDLKHREINPYYLARFFHTKLNDYSSDQTFYKNIKSVKAGEVLEINNANFNIKRKLNIKKFPIKNFQFQSKECVKNDFKNDFQKAVSARLISDAPVGVLMSGGLDSSAIVSNIINLKKKENVNFFYARQFITNENKVSEDDHYVKILSKHFKIKLNEIDLLKDHSKIEEIFLKLSKQFEEPFNIELTSIPIYLISKEMSNKGIKVSIDGVGGDEILSGYPSFLSLANSNLIKNNFLNFINYFKLHMSYSNSNHLSNFLLIASLLKNKFFPRTKRIDNKIYSNKFKDYIDSIHLVKLRAKYETVIKRQLFELFKFQIPYYLKISDQCNMINNVENRSPFLDFNLFKYVFLKNEFKFKSGYMKILLREVLIDDLPKEIVFRKNKSGFGSSIDINNLKTKKNIEMTLDCEVIRLILAKDINSKKILNEKALFKNLLILSYLSTQYPLKLDI